MGMRLFNKPLFHVAVIIVIVLLVYSNTFNAPFQFDDSVNIEFNPAIKDLRYFSDLSALEDNTLSGRPGKPLFKTRYIGYLTFALNYRVHGLDVRGYHLVNISVHIINALLLYWLMILTFRTPFFSAFDRELPFPGESRNFIAFFSALFFAVHPIQTQAVTYIVQRFASLATLFYLLSLVLYIKWKENREKQPKRYPLRALLYTTSLLSAILAMKTKEFAFTLPLVMALYEAFFFRGTIVKRMLSLVPFFLAILLIPLALIGGDGSVALVSGINEGAVNLSGDRASISSVDYLFTEFRVIVTYIRLLFFPVHQNLDYDYPIFNSFFNSEVVLSFLFLLSVILLGIYFYRLSKRAEGRNRFWLRLISFGIFWFFITLSSESGVIPIIDVIFEHRVYLPSIGFFVALTAAIEAGRERLGERAAYAKRAVLTVMLAVMLVLAGAAYARNDLWNDGVKLWGNAVEGSPGKPRPRGNLGLAYAKQGRVDEAIRELERAVKLKPDFAEAHYDLGVAYIAKNRIHDGIREFQAVLMLLPDHAQAHNNLALAYMNQGRTEDALREFQILMMISPSEYPLAPKFIEFLRKQK